MPMRLVRSWALRHSRLLAWLVWLLCASPAHAADNLHRIRVVLVGRAAEDASLGQRITSWFDATRFDVEVSTKSYLDPRHVLVPDDSAELHVFIVVAGDELARFYFARIAPSDHRVTYLLRDLRLSTGLDELGKERMAQVTTLSALALLEGQAQSTRTELEQTLRSSSSGATEREQVARDRPTTSAPPTQRATASPPTTRASSRLHLHSGLGYGLSPRGDEGLFHGPRASLGVETPLVDLGLELTGFLPVRRDFGTVRLRFAGLGLLCGAATHIVLSRDLKLEGLAGFGFDLVDYRTDWTAATVVPDRGATELRPTFGIRGALAPEFIPIRLIAGATLQLVRTHYDAVGDDTQRHELGHAPTIAFVAGLEAHI
jgi:hypothetical protein